MKVSEALKIVLELAQQNMLVDPEMPDEMKQQADAVETVNLFMLQGQDIHIKMVDNQFLEATSDLPGKVHTSNLLFGVEHIGEPMEIKVVQYGTR